MKEFDIIREFFLPLSNQHEFCLNLSDDTAKILLKNNEHLIVSKDIFAENTHFFLQDGGFKIASKLLLTNLSDIASSGAKPFCYMLGFSKNHRTDYQFCLEFAKGLRDVQQKYGIFLLGGDTINSKKGLFFSITVFGILQNKNSLKRNGAEDGDLIFTSGTIGDAGLGLISLKCMMKNFQDSTIEGYQRFLIDRHYFPTPKIELGESLLKNQISKCAIDVSDGLLSDLKHVCEASSLSARIFLDKIPISESAQHFLNINPSHNKLKLLASGDDYELIFSAKSSKRAEIQKLVESLKLKISEIGFFEKSNSKPEIIIIDSSTNKIQKKIKIKKFGYEH